jgi:rhodanese-related sulfurtransferase
MTTSVERHSAVTDAPAAADAADHFAARLAYETDAADVHDDLAKGVDTFLLIDARDPGQYAEGHLPGAVNLPARRINATTAAGLPTDRVLVTYCAGPGCNASTKAAARLARLGYAVKEMPGGVEWWLKDGYDLTRD